MKYIHLVSTVVSLLFILLSSCSEEEKLKSTEHSPLKFELNLKGGNSVTSTRAAGDELKVFVFVYNATDNSVPIIQLEDILTSDNAILYYTPTDNFVRTSSYNIFTVATINEAIQTTLKSPISQTALLDLIQNQTDLGSNSDEYIVSGGLKGVNFNNPSKAINLFRNVCRMELTVTDQTTNKYKSIEASFDAPDQTYIFSSDVRENNSMPDGAIDAVNQITFAKNENIYTNACYFFEKGDGLTLKIQAVGIGETGADTTFNYKVVLANTVRNTIYRINAGLNLTGLTVETSTNLDWKGNIDENQELIPVNP